MNTDNPIEPLKKPRKKKRKIEAMQRRDFLNLPNMSGNALISGSIGSCLESHHAYILTITDCHGDITLHGSLKKPEDLKNFKHKLGKIVSVCQEMLDHVDKEMKKGG